MTDPIHIIGVIDIDGNEALYVGGDLNPIDGNTIFFIDVSIAVGDKTCQLSRVELSTEIRNEWPVRFEELMPYIITDEPGTGTKP